MDSISETRLLTVYPVLAHKIQQMAAQLEDEGILIRCTQGLRTIEEQDALYAQGRTKPGPRVTNARGGESYHNFGLAADFVPSVPGNTFIPDWNAEHPSWKRMIFVGESLGMVSGAHFIELHDAPHFQITGKYPVGAPNDELRELLAWEGLEGVWQSVSGETPIPDVVLRTS